MRTLSPYVALALTASSICAEPGRERVGKLFKSENYTVNWGRPAAFDPTSELEIGNGSGHGSVLGWTRFHPRGDGVDVLSIRFEDGRRPYKSKWPPDTAPVVIKSGRMKRDVYAALLADLALADAAKLEPVERNTSTGTTSDFWVYARLSADKKTRVDWNWAGYESSEDEIQYAKPRAAARLALDAVSGPDLKDHALTEEERAWAGEKFVRDWKRFKDAESHWWVRERYVIMVGVVGDSSVLSTLRDILGGNPKDRCVYLAINAVTRLTKQDLRDRPVEEMDVEATRRKVIGLIKNAKSVGGR